MFPLPVKSHHKYQSRRNRESSPGKEQQTKINDTGSSFTRGGKSLSFLKEKKGFEKGEA